MRPSLLRPPSVDLGPTLRLHRLVRKTRPQRPCDIAADEAS